MGTLATSFPRLLGHRLPSLRTAISARRRHGAHLPPPSVRSVPPSRLTALPSAQAQAGRWRAGGGCRSGAAPRSRSASRGVSQCSHVWRREAAGRAWSAAPSVRRRRRRTRGGGGHPCRRAGISAADTQPSGGGGRPVAPFPRGLWRERAVPT